MLYVLDDGSIKYWDCSTRSRITSTSCLSEGLRPELLQCVPEKNIGALTLISKRRDERLASRVQFFSVEGDVINLHTSIELQGNEEIISMDWSSDGSMLVMGCTGGLIRLYDPAKTTTLTSWSVSDTTPKVAFAPDGRAVLVIDNTSRKIIEWTIDEDVNNGSGKEPILAFVYRLQPDTIASKLFKAKHVRFDASGDQFIVGCEHDAQSLLLIYQVS